MDLNDTVLVPASRKGELHTIAQELVKRLPDTLDRLETFLKGFKPNRYRTQLQDIYGRIESKLVVYMDDLEELFVHSIIKFLDPLTFCDLKTNCLRHVEMMYSAADAVMREDPIRTAETAVDRFVAIEVDKRQGILQRTLNLPEREEIAAEVRLHLQHGDFEVQREEGMRLANVPPYLRCHFEILLFPSTDVVPILLRDALLAENVGSFITLEADVVRASPKYSKARVAGYKCKICSDLVYQPVTGPQFMPLFECPRPTCVRAESKNTLTLATRYCRFGQHQDIRVQEPAHQVPQGKIPYTLNCVLSGQMAGNIIPGSTVMLSGVLRTVHRTGFAAIKGKDRNEVLFEILSLRDTKNRESETPEETRKIDEGLEHLLQQDRIFERLAFNIAPEIYGQEDVKKALLLQMVGGVMRTKKDGGMIRGDMHILLMGDPGVAKSQLMKRICQLSSRAVYATGMGSSGVGLTAAVTKDPLTGDSSLEGGALVMADRGICAIDEFDKMDEYDRSAIYEVMEQQSVSVAKAGHCTSLPARCAVLAAANPIDGRYDTKKSVLANVNMPAALLTRFDLQFLILDTPDRIKDVRTATHILKVMRGQTETFQLYEPINERVFRRFLAKCKQFSPRLPKNIAAEIAEYYADTRAVEERQETSQSDERIAYTTLRSVLAILRLCQALARLRFSDVIDQSDLLEARRLIDASKYSVTGREAKKRVDSASDVFELISRLWKKHVVRYGRHTEGLPIAEVERQALVQGIKKRTLDNVIAQYVENTVFSINDAETHLTVLTVDEEEEEQDDNYNCLFD